MNKLFKTLSLMAAIAFFATACLPPVVEAAQAAPAEVGYQAVLGKSLSDLSVADFLAGNSCTQAARYHICRPTGLALWSDADQVVKTAYLYLNDSHGFTAYKGDLPLGLAPDDTMADVQQKLGQPRDVHVLPGPWEPGLPDQGRSPDHVYFWAIYRRFGVTIIYNTPVASDKNASIHAILVSK